jgi:hypothetical protein
MQWTKPSKKLRIQKENRESSFIYVKVQISACERERVHCSRSNAGRLLVWYNQSCICSYVRRTNLRKVRQPVVEIQCPKLWSCVRPTGAGNVHGCAGSGEPAVLASRHIGRCRGTGFERGSGRDEAVAWERLSEILREMRLEPGRGAPSAVGRRRWEGCGGDWRWRRHANRGERFRR